MMGRFKQLVRYIRLSLTIILIIGSVGIGGISPLLPNKREKYMDKQITIEQVDKKEDEDDTDLREIKE